MMLQAWGKTDKDSGEFHPLAHHSMDVAAVLARMLQLPVVRDRLEAAADAALTESTCRRLAALVFLHDIGKLHPGFQAKGWADGIWRGPTTGHLKESWAFLMLAVQRPEHPFHATIRRILDWGEAVPLLMGAMFAHHGRPVERPSSPTLREWPSLAHYDWRTEARGMSGALQRWFPEAFESGCEHLPRTPRFCHEIAGLAALADWIGSDRQFFEFKAPFVLDYDAQARDAAECALAAIGFDSRALAATPAPSFRKLTDFPKPNPAQAAVGSVDSDARLVILEAETGSGQDRGCPVAFYAAFPRQAWFRASTSQSRRAPRPDNCTVASRTLYAEHSAKRRRTPFWPFRACCGPENTQADACPIGASSGTTMRQPRRNDGRRNTRRGSWPRQSPSEPWIRRCSRDSR